MWVILVFEFVVFLEYILARYYLLNLFCANDLASENQKAPTGSGRGPRCAPRSFHSLRCLRRPSSRRPVAPFIPTRWRLVRRLRAGDKKGDALDEPRRSKHHRPKAEERGSKDRRSFVITREQSSLERQRVAGVERVGAF